MEFSCDEILGLGLPERSAAMLDIIAAGCVAAGLFVYLAIVLIAPERF